MIRPNPHVADMVPYALATLVAPAGQAPVSLSQNESLRPPSPNALQAATDALADTMLYPDPDWSDLRGALATLHGIDALGILCGAGSLDLIGCITRAYAGPGRAVLAPEHAYPFFETAARMVGARFDRARETCCTVSVDNTLEAVRPDTSVVFVANPGNPTGTRVAGAELRRLRQGLAGDILLVVDEAYGEFGDHLNEPSFDMVGFGNTIVLRTFSKAYGMAGLRIGWGFCPADSAGELRKVANPNGVSVAAQAAALAAVQDQAYMRDTCRLTVTSRDAAQARLQAAGFAVLPSFTNFLLIDFGTVENAVRADADLRARGLFLRGQGGAGLPHCLRMTIGPDAAMAQALAALEDWKEGQGT